MVHYAIGIGSNRGDRAAYLAQAAASLQADGMVRVTASSPLLETAPVGGPPGQGAFLNGAWIVVTGLGPHQLLHRLLVTEAALGRCRLVPCGPRTVDLDLLLAEDGRILDGPTLTLPHPRLHQRPFVLIPLATIAPAWRHPTLRRSVAELRHDLERESPR